MQFLSLKSVEHFGVVFVVPNEVFVVFNDKISIFNDKKFWQRKNVLKMSINVSFAISLTAYLLLRSST